MSEEPDTADAGDADATRCWLVERSYDDRNLITLVYATPDGARQLRKEIAAVVIHQGNSTVTAAIEASPADLSPVTDEETRERYASEAARMAEQHDPDDPI